MKKFIGFTLTILMVMTMFVVPIKAESEEKVNVVVEVSTRLKESLIDQAKDDWEKMIQGLLVKKNLSK